MNGSFLIFIAAVLWGLDGVLRRSLFSLPPITIVFFEHIIGLILISPFLFRAWKREKLSTQDWSVFGLVSLFSGVLGTLFFTTALLKVNFISFSVVFLLQKLQPLFTIITAIFVLREYPSRSYFAWALLALAAGFFVTFPDGQIDLENGAVLSAALFAFLAAVAWGSSTAFSRFLLLRHSNTFVTGMRFLLTVPIALIFVFLLGSAPTLAAVTLPQFFTFVLIAASTGMLALWIYYRGLARVPAGISAVVELAFPLTAIFIDYLLYGTVLASSQYIAGGVLLYAMYQVTQAKMTTSVRVQAVAK